MRCLECFGVFVFLLYLGAAQAASLPLESGLLPESASAPKSLIYEIESVEPSNEPSKDLTRDKRQFGFGGIGIGIGGFGGGYGGGPGFGGGYGGYGGYGGGYGGYGKLY